MNKGRYWLEYKQHRVENFTCRSYCHECSENVTRSTLIFAYLWMRSPREGNFWIDLKRKERRNQNHTHLTTTLAKYTTLYAFLFIQWRNSPTRA